MLKQIDWVFLRRPLIIFGVLLGSAIIFYIGGDQFKNIAEGDFLNAKGSLSSSHSKLNKQSKEIALVDKYLIQYKDLENTGFIGDERRLSWIESIKATNKKIKLPQFKYAIKPQVSFVRPGIKSSKTVKSLASPMTLSLGLLHEEDLFNVLDILDDQVQSRFIIDSCSFSKGKGNDLKVDRQNLSAKCDLQWIHLSVASK